MGPKSFSDEDVFHHIVLAASEHYIMFYSIFRINSRAARVSGRSYIHSHESHFKQTKVMHKRIFVPALYVQIFTTE